VKRALTLAADKISKHGGSVTSGGILDDGGDAFKLIPVVGAIQGAKKSAKWPLKRRASRQSGCDLAGMESDLRSLSNIGPLAGSGGSQQG
jgi:hypothetical protein